MTKPRPVARTHYLDVGMMAKPDPTPLQEQVAALRALPRFARSSAELQEFIALLGLDDAVDHLAGHDARRSA